MTQHVIKKRDVPFILISTLCIGFSLALICVVWHQLTEYNATYIHMDGR